MRGACPTSDDVRAYRYLVVSSQYRNPLSFTEAALGAAKGALKRLDRAKAMIEEALSEGQVDTNMGDSAIVATVEKELANFEVAIADDLSMPRASACLFSVVKAAENEFKRVAKAAKNSEKEQSDVPPLDLVGFARVLQALDQMDQVFGIYYDVPKAKGGESEDGGNSIDEGDDVSIPEEVMELVVQRTAAKEAKNWELADSLRAKLTELGYAVKDVKGGNPTVSRV